jgi:hypothetical protein
VVQYGATRRVERVNVGAMVQEERDEDEPCMFGGDMQSCPARGITGPHEVFVLA